jgi:hypothetical protein
MAFEPQHGQQNHSPDGQPPGPASGGVEHIDIA